MRDTLLMVFASVIFTAGIIAAANYGQNHQANPPPQNVTCRILDCDPDFFAGSEVRVKLEGCEQAGGSELVYRKVSGDPPAVSLRFSKPVPDKAEWATGICKGRRSGVVVVDNCRP